MTSDQLPKPPSVATQEDRHRLIVDTMPLVQHLVREVSARIPASVDRDDLRSAGLAALVAAGESFDPGRGAPFAAYAAIRIRGAIVDELRSIDWASRSVRRRGREIDDTRQRLATSLGAFPNNEMVARTLGMTVQEVTRADADVARASVIALDAGEQGIEDLLPSDGPSPADLTERAEQRAFVADAIAELPERLRLVITQYFLLERPMAEIGAELGVTESRVSQLRAEALVLLREALDTAYDQQHAPVVPDGVAARRRRAYTEAVAARNAARYPRQSALTPA
jgi:RNA polymerase sigma factor FliA